ncbi:MAG: Ig-like domain-containing protein [Spirochaetota bacterium]
MKRYLLFYLCVFNMLFLLNCSKDSSDSSAGSVPAQSVSLSETACSIPLGGFDQLTATVTPAGANQNVTWHSQSTDIATVDANGKVYAVTAGTTIVTAASEDGGFSDSCVVTTFLYNAGDFSDGSDEHPGFWGGAALLTLDSVKGCAYSPVIVSGTTAYYAGYYMDGTDEKPCYWKGTQRINLSAGASSTAYATAVAYANIPPFPSVVYTSGYYDSGGVFVPCYWTDTSRTDLTGVAGHNAYATSIAVTGIFVSQKIYVGGFYVDSSASCYIPCYWENSQRMDLNISEYLDGFVYGLTVYEDTVYTAGNVDFSTPCYWTGSTQTPLPTGGRPGDAMAITVYNGTVYTAGYYNNGTKDVPCYWAGTSRTNLTGGGSATENAYASSIIVSGGKVYTSGCYMSNGKAIPCYWEDTDRVDLDTYNNNGGAVCSPGYDIW